MAENNGKYYLIVDPQRNTILVPHNDQKMVDLLVSLDLTKVKKHQNPNILLGYVQKFLKGDINYESD